MDDNPLGQQGVSGSLEKKNQKTCCAVLFSFDVRAELCFLVMIPSPEE